jgi:glutamate synthase (NADH)
MKRKISTARPYGAWLDEEVITLEQIISSVPADKRVPPAIKDVEILASSNGNGNGAAASNGKGSRDWAAMRRLLKPLTAFGYTIETMEMLLLPMAKAGADPLGSMGNDSPLAIISQRPKLLYDYFKQLFAQVGC